MTATPIAFTVFRLSADAYSLSIDKVRPGGTVEAIEKGCKARGYGLSPTKDRITCDGDWTVVFTDVDGRADALTFANERLIEKAKNKLNGATAWL